MNLLMQTEKQSKIRDSKSLTIKIVVKEGADINHEATDAVELQVRSTSEAGVQYTTTVSVEIIDINEAPTTTSFSFEIQEDSSLDGNLLTNAIDEDGDKLVVSDYSQPANGSVIVDANGDFVYEPVENFSGTDTFQYEVSDGNGLTVTESVTIEIASVADGVEFDASNARGQEHEAISLDIGASLIDADGSENISQVIVRGVPQNAELSAGTQLADGSWELTADELAGLEIQLEGLGNEDFTLSVEVTSEDGGDVKVQTTSVDVDVQNDALTAKNIREVLGANQCGTGRRGTNSSDDSRSRIS